MPEQIHKLTQELLAELGKTGSLDEGARQRIQQLAQEIDEAVDPDHERTMGDESLSQLEEAAVGFESDHPRIAGILRGLSDTLGKLGI